MNDYDLENLALNWLKLKKMSVKNSTYIKYESIVENQILPFFKDMKEKEFNDDPFIDFFNEKRKTYSDSSLKAIKYVLNSILKLGYEKNDLPFIHMNRIRFQKLNKITDVLTETQKNILIVYCKNHYNALSVSMLIALYGGLRIGEICALKWENINFQEHTISVTGTAQRQKVYGVESKWDIVITEPKSSTSKRIVPIPAFLIAYLETYKHTEENTDFVLSNSSQIYEPRRIQDRFKRLCNKNDFDTHFHILRHSYATHCVQQNVDIKTLSEILGHSNVSTTLQLYVHTSLEQKKKEIEKIKTPSWS